MIESVKITKLFLNDKTKDGKDIISPWTNQKTQKIAIQTDKHVGYFSAFINGQRDPKLQLKVGDRVDIIVWEKDGFKNFKLPTKTDYLEDRVEKLELDMDELREIINTPDERTIKEESLEKLNAELAGQEPEEELPF